MGRREGARGPARRRLRRAALPLVAVLAATGCAAEEADVSAAAGLLRDLPAVAAVDVGQDDGGGLPLALPSFRLKAELVPTATAADIEQVARAEQAAMGIPGLRATSCDCRVTVTRGGRRIDVLVTKTIDPAAWSVLATILLDDHRVTAASLDPRSGEVQARLTDLAETHRLIVDVGPLPAGAQWRITAAETGTTVIVPGSGGGEALAANLFLVGTSETAKAWAWTIDLTGSDPRVWSGPIHPGDTLCRAPTAYFDPGAPGSTLAPMVRALARAGPGTTITVTTEGCVAALEVGPGARFHAGHLPTPLPPGATDITTELLASWAHF